MPSAWRGSSTHGSYCERMSVIHSRSNVLEHPSSKICSNKKNNWYRGGALDTNRSTSTIYDKRVAAALECNIANMKLRVWKRCFRYETPIELPIAYTPSNSTDNRNVHFLRFLRKSMVRFRQVWITRSCELPSMQWTANDDIISRCTNYTVSQLWSFFLELVTHIHIYVYIHMHIHTYRMYYK